MCCLNFNKILKLQHFGEWLSLHPQLRHRTGRQVDTVYGLLGINITKHEWRKKMWKIYIPQHCRQILEGNNLLHIFQI
jgi:hypothetical protein